MIVISRSHDSELLASLVGEMWADVSVDQIEEMPDISGLLDLEGIVFVVAEVDGDIAGGFLVIHGEVHTLIRPEFRGRLAIDIAKRAVSWWFDNFGGSAITSYYYSDRPDVRLFCRLVGFRDEAVEDSGYTRNGVQVRKHIVSIRK